MCTRVSPPCWPCLCVMFMCRSITHKKSQHTSTSTSNIRTYAVNAPAPPGSPDHSKTLGDVREGEREARVHPRKYAVVDLLER